MPFLFRRMLETIGFQFLLSLIFSTPFHFGWLPQKVGPIMIAMLLCITLNLIFFFICLKGYLVSVEDIKCYFITNYLVLFILCTGAVALAIFNVEPLYSFLFFPFQVLNLISECSKAVAAILSSVFLFAFVAIAPFFMEIEI